ncbi:PAB-dependent poly(A)-specific ribonuclease subunit 2, partial [Acrasis kona]
ITLTQEGIQSNSKNGLLQFCYTDSRFEDSLLGMGWASGWFGTGQSKLVLGGNIEEVFSFDLATQKIVDAVESQGSCVIKPGTKYLCVGHTSGQVSLRDPRSLSMEHVFNAHALTINTIDVKGDLMVTCGWEDQDQYGMYPDTMIRVFDLRTNRQLGSCHFRYCPTFVKFHPMFSSMIVASSTNGQFQFMDIQQNLITEDSYTIPTNNAYLYANNTQTSITNLELSSSGENLLFGNSIGMIHVWSTNGQLLPQLNPNSRHTQDDTNYNNMLSDSVPLSDWPVGTKCSPCKLQTIHPAIFGKLKMKGALICENPGLENLTDGYIENQVEKTLRIVPKRYIRLNIKPSKQKFQEFDFSKFNSTKYSGLENVLQYTQFVNATVQVLYHLSEPLRTSFMNHLCDKTHCLSCELGFLFYMFQQAEKQSHTHRTLSANNLIRTLRGLDPEFFSGMDQLIEQKTSNTKLCQLFFDFVIKTCCREMTLETPIITSSPKKLQISKKKKQNIIETFFGCYKNEVFALSHDVPPSNHWNTAIMNMLSGCVSPPPCLTLQCTVPAWIRTAHVNNQKTCIPPHFDLQYDPSQGVWLSSTKDYRPRSQHIHYQLKAFIINILDPTSQKETGHCAAYILKENNWVLFNDFQVSVDVGQDVLYFGRSYKTPSTLFYMRSDAEQLLPNVIYKNPITIKKAYGQSTESIDFPKKGDKVAIDAEFVLLSKNHGANTNHLDWESQLFSLGRVTVLLDKGLNVEPIVFLDDYIVTANENVSDYMTRFSGLKEGDLDPELSTHHVMNLKSTYIKLRALADIGVIFVGHGLKNDFKIINVFVPKEQTIDTVEIYQLPRQRKISLRFLSKNLLGKDIQQETHSSEEDASASLKLYHLYLELQEKNKFEETLERVYTIGRNTNWNG